jgi:hypothetical protein
MTTPSDQSVRTDPEESALFQRHLFIGGRFFSATLAAASPRQQRDSLDWKIRGPAITARIELAAFTLRTPPRAAASYGAVRMVSMLATAAVQCFESSKPHRRHPEFTSGFMPA